MSNPSIFTGGQPHMFCQALVISQFNALLFLKLYKDERVKAILK